MKQYLRTIKIKWYNAVVSILKKMEKYTNNFIYIYTKRLHQCYNRDGEEQKERRGTVYSIFDIANWFLAKESMTHKKLQKLCYYAQAWYCALHEGHLLINDEFQAWVHGPVCPTLYHEYSSHGWNPIELTDESHLNIDEDTEQFLGVVYNTYKRYSGDELEFFTHQELPWKKARKDCKPWESSKSAIEIKDMHDYYLDIYVKAQDD